MSGRYSIAVCSYLELPWGIVAGAMLALPVLGYVAEAAGRGCGMSELVLWRLAPSLAAVPQIACLRMQQSFKGGSGLLCISASSFTAVFTSMRMSWQTHSTLQTRAMQRPSLILQLDQNDLNHIRLINDQHHGFQAKWHYMQVQRKAT